MKGLFLMLQGEFTDDSLARFYPEDAMLNKGSLYLFKPSNSQGYDNGAAVPVNGTLMPNLAWRPAKRMIGAGDRTSLSSLAVVPAPAAADKVELKLEWTPKKGLHVITSQTNMSQGKGFAIPIPDSIVAYLHAYSETHQFYFSVIEKVTRAPNLSSGDDNRLLITSNASASNNYLLRLQKQILPAVGTPGRVDAYSSGNSYVLGQLFRNLATKAWTGNKEVNASSITNKAITVGPVGAYASIDQNKSSSTVLYQVYIEDLTVSGRTYAQAHAADLAAYTTAFAAGGVFNGDTIPTDPTTIP